MSNGLKVYHVPSQFFHGQNSFMDTILLKLPLHRNIFIRERIDIVHAHQIPSTLAYEATLVAKMMGLKTVFTDHSLYAFDGLIPTLANKGSK